ncbi:hypothetical protein TNCV_3665861 [Trichonephila clavipes]|nr:hypothetical protein TNCV_3665861 [Trichonephila clavipes]
MHQTFPCLTPFLYEIAILYLWRANAHRVGFSTLRELLRLGKSEGCDLISPQFRPRKSSYQKRFNASITKRKPHALWLPTEFEFRSGFLLKNAIGFSFTLFIVFRDKQAPIAVAEASVYSWRKVLIDQVYTKMVLLPVVPFNFVKAC